ncbi:hypothetical protein HDU77_011185 [Chytriomyces hyalinus]|nr:hypothetical protein HDU77_011185 [Chytriomyces hyalinus]
MKFVSNLPDQEHVPYKFIAAEPHFKYVMSYMRSSDIVMAGAIGAGFPAAHMVWVRFWGWKENAIEAARWENEASQRNAEKPKGWMDGTDW